MKDESVLTNWFISSDSIIINNSHEERHTLEERKLINIKGRMDVEGRGGGLSLLANIKGCKALYCNS